MRGSGINLRQTGSWYFRIIILTRFSPRFIINRVQIKLMYRHSIDSTNSIHVNVLVVFANGCSVLCCSSGSSWLEIPVDRWCIRCTNKLMTSNTLRYKKVAISNNSQAITVERACTIAKHKKCTVHTWFIQFQTKKGKSLAHDSWTQVANLVTFTAILVAKIFFYSPWQPKWSPLGALTIHLSRMCSAFNYIQ